MWGSFFGGAAARKDSPQAAAGREAMLAKAEAALQSLRSMNPADAEAFPVLNDAVRLGELMENVSMLLPVAVAAVVVAAKRGAQSRWWSKLELTKHAQPPRLPPQFNSWRWRSRRWLPTTKWCGACESV